MATPDGDGQIDAGTGLEDDANRRPRPEICARYPVTLSCKSSKSFAGSFRIPEVPQ